MPRTVDILILRDPRESPAKCSLTHLRGMAGIRFVEYRPGRRLDGGGRILLSADGAELSPADRGRGLLLIDCSWRRVAKLLRTVDGEYLPRGLRGWRTAYPRRSKTLPDPGHGLASVEALDAALHVLGTPRPEILDGYRWRREFLEQNPTRRRP